MSCAWISGCASKAKPDPTVSVPAGQYTVAFEAAKDALREFQFDLERVDAAGGIVTTHRRGSAGFATPWVPHSSSVSDMGEGFVERERRHAAVVFLPVGAAEPVSAEAGSDAQIDYALQPIDTEAELTAKVHVWVERVYRPGRRVSAASVRLSSFTSDPELREEGLEPAFAVETREDPALGARLAAWMSGRIAGVAR